MTYLFMAVCQHRILYFLILSFSIMLGIGQGSVMQTSFWMKYLFFSGTLWLMIRFFYRVVLYWLEKRSYDISHNAMLPRIFISLSLIFCLYLPFGLLFGASSKGEGFLLLLMFVVVYFILVSMRLIKRMGFSGRYISFVFVISCLLGLSGTVIFLTPWVFLLS